MKHGESSRNCNYLSLIFSWPFWSIAHCKVGLTSWRYVSFCRNKCTELMVLCAVSRHQSNYKENYIFVSIANCLVNLLNISLPNHFVQQFSSSKKVRQALFNVTLCCSYNIGNTNHTSLLSCKTKPHPFFAVLLAGI